MDIKNYVARGKELLREKISAQKATPCLVVVQVNDDPASNSYVRGKLKDCAEIGMLARLEKYPEDISEKELLQVIDRLNHDDSVHGFIVQMPLPKHIHTKTIELAIDPKKDVDGFHPLSHFTPCTPLGILRYLKEENVSFENKNAVVIGRSDIVGKPMAKLLLKENANVTVLHSKTSPSNLEAYVAQADIIVVAVGKAHFFSPSVIKKDAVVVDVGINRGENGLVGDCVPNLPVFLQTPVPGGVGLLTRFTLLENVWEAYQNEISD